MSVPKNEKELLQWAIQNSEDPKNVRPDHLMSPQEFKQMWEEICPDELQQLKANLETIRSNPPEEKLLEALDRVLFIVEGIDAADWFVDLKGYELMLPLLGDPNTEKRMAAAWIISNTLQNNPKDQEKFLNQVGLHPIFEALSKETEQKPAVRLFSLISNAVRQFKPLKEMFFQEDGIKKLQEACEKFKPLYFRFTWLVGAILDEEDAEDLQKLQTANVKQYILDHTGDIDDEEMMNNVINRL